MTITVGKGMAITKWLVSGLVALSTSCQFAGPRADSEAKITGGEKVLKSAHPAARHLMHATIPLYSTNKTLRCTGTLISPTLVLTAAHCFVKKNGSLIESKVFMTFPFAGVPHRTIDVKKSVVISKTFDPSVSPVKFKDDVAIIRLDPPAPSLYQPANLLAPDAELAEVDVGFSQVRKRGQGVIVSGFGRIGSQGDAGRTMDFKMTEMEVFLVDDRGRRLQLSDDDSSACTGDSGGPAYIFDGKKLTLAGVTSAASCDAKNSYKVAGRRKQIPVFRVTSMDVRKLLPWLESILSAEEKNAISFASPPYQAPSSPRDDDETVAIIKRLRGSR